MWIWLARIYLAKIRILYWNANKDSKNCRQLLRSDFDILAFQEPTAEGNYPLCLRSCNFYMIYGGGRAVIYIHKRHPLASWTYEAHRDYCKITLNGIDFYLIYSLIPSATRRARLATLWLSPIHMLAESERPNKAILMGDFNLHHPLWDLFERETYGAEALLQLAED